MTEAPAASVATSPIWRPWATIAVCLIAGPPIGLVASVIPFAVMAAAERGWLEGVQLLPVALFPLAWVFAYMFGAVPALLSAALYVWLDRVAPVWLSRPLAAFAVGALVAAVLSLFVFGIRPSGAMALTAVVGGVSGGVCAHLTRHWRYRGGGEL